MLPFVIITILNTEKLDFFYIIFINMYIEKFIIKILIMPKKKYIDDNHDKYFAIWVNATNDINPCQKLEFATENKEIISSDSFELFFSDSDNSKEKYGNIFKTVERILNQNESTKFPIYSHTTNTNEIKEWKTQDFIISVVINKWEKAIDFNIWRLLSKEEVDERLNKLWHWDKGIDLDNYWLNWIISWEDSEWYINLFNYWIWWWTHNIASSIESFAKVIKSKWFKIVAPNFLDKTNKYTSRTSLFFQDEDWTKYCLRTDALESQLEVVKDIIDKNKNLISDILVTDKKTLDLQWVWLHSVPTKFDENVLHNVSTVVFNCEDREMWEVIDAVISEAKLFLEENHLDFITKTKLINLLNGLIFLKKKLDNYNKLIFNKRTDISNIRDRIKDYEKSWIEKEKIKEWAKIKLTNDEIVDLWIKRVNVLKEILPTLVEVTKISEKLNLDSNNNVLNIGQKDENLWRVVLFTDWSDWSVWSIESDNHEVFFTNSIWNIWKYEKIFLRKLKSLSLWQIDIDVTDTTWCWDSSTLSALMIREKYWINIRKQKYIEILTSMWVPEYSFSRAFAVIEAYFLSHLQEVNSWVIYHCKKSNIWDIPNSEFISNMILSYAFDNTLEFIEKWMKNFIYSIDNSIVIDWRVYNWFNVYKISEL